jgi:tetratricopeptide (TPR) repeat protein
MNVALLLLLAAEAARPGPVLVFPSEPSSADLAWVGEIVAERLPRDLALLGVPVVDRADRLRAQEALGIPRGAASRATALRVAEVLGATRIVVGRHAADGKALTLALQILDVERGTLSAPLRASGPGETLPELVHALAWDVALAGPVRPSRTRQELAARQEAVPPAALEAHGRGLAAPDAASRQQWIRRALALAPGYDAARLALGRLLLEARDHSGAVDTLSRVAVASPLNRRARFLQGLALVELGRYREAAALYAGLAGEDPTAAVLNNHAIALLRSGTQPGGGGVRPSDELRRAAELAPQDEEIPVNLGFALLAEGDAEAAAFWLRGVARERPSDGQVRLLLSWALRRAGKAAEADEEWTSLLAVAPSFEALAIPDLGRRFERLLLSERPLVLDEDARSDAELAAVHLGRAAKLQDEGDREAAVKELMRAVYLDPYGARGHLLLSRAYRAGGEADKALAELRTSLWCKDDPGVRLELASYLAELGKSAESRSEARRVLKLEPGNVAAKALAERN